MEKGGFPHGREEDSLRREAYSLRREAYSLRRGFPSLGERLPSLGERYSLPRYTHPTHHGVYATLPGTPCTAYRHTGTRRTTGHTRLTALTHRVAEPIVGERRVSAQQCVSVLKVVYSGITSGRV